MKKFSMVLFSILLLGVSLKVLAQPQTPALAQNASKTSAKKATAGDEGERRFQENCGRCHNYPDSISPREVKAVVRHMRVRALLSAEDERLILKYLAP